MLNANDNKSTKIDLPLKLILVYRLILGQYYDLSSCRLICFVIKFYCFCFLFGMTFLVYDYFIKHLQSIQGNIYYWFLVLEASYNILFSLFNVGRPILSFSSRINTLMISNQFSPCTLKCYGTHIFVLASHMLVALSLLGIDVKVDGTYYKFCVYILIHSITYSGRLTTMYMAEMFQRSIKLVKTSLDTSLMDENQSDGEKITHVRKFIYVYINLSHTLSGAVNFMRLQVIIC